MRLVFPASASVPNTGFLPHSKGRLDRVPSLAWFIYIPRTAISAVFFRYQRANGRLGDSLWYCTTFVLLALRDAEQLDSMTLSFQESESYRKLLVHRRFFLSGRGHVYRSKGEPWVRRPNIADCLGVRTDLGDHTSNWEPQ